jgi:glycosyltransferase involved in cell wall biosynthesis
MKPTASLILCTFERPRNLRMSLASLLGQRGAEGQFEVIVADDGSRDETPQIVEEFQQRADFPIHFTTHPHAGFCLSQSRNEAVAASSGEYLIFLDGDCMVPPEHIAMQLAHRAPGVARIGDCIRLPENVSAQVTEEVARRGDYVRLASSASRGWLYRKAWKDWYYNLVRSRKRPSLVGANFALSREDYDRVNGFDENFVGWGNEDDDFGSRLKRAGLRLQSILFWTSVYHLWHPLVPSFPKTLAEGANIPYARRGFHLTCCGNGLTKRTWRDLTFDLRGDVSRHALQAIIPQADDLRSPESGASAEVELLFGPTKSRFTGKAECNVLVIPENTGEKLPQARQADLIICPSAQAASLSGSIEPARLFGVDEFLLAMQYLLRHERDPRRIARAA